MSFKKFCAKCGKETEALISGVCSDCFLKKNNIFELTLPSFGVCKHCGKFLSSGKWFILTSENIGLEVSKKVKTNHNLDKPKVFAEVAQTAPLTYQLAVKVEGFIENVLIEQEKSYGFSVKSVTCDSCMKLNADYREAVLQLRANSKEKAKEMYETAISMLDSQRETDSLSGTSKIIQIPQGYDLWIGSKKAASKIARYMSKTYNVQVTLSKKIIGEEGGRGHFIYRHTFCIKRED